MQRHTIWVTILLFGLALCGSAVAQKHGGVLTLPSIDSPPGPSLQEEATVTAVVPFMPLYNNLVIYDQHKPQNSAGTIVPELATAWAWDDSHTELTFTLRQGVRWHDGQNFTAADVKCTWDMVSGLTPGKIRKSPRAEWFANLVSITVASDTEVTFHLKRPQPSLLAMLASGYSPVYPCHVPSAAMRTKPVGTGPFRFVEYRMNEVIRLERNPDYWKPGLPYLDGIEYTISHNRSTAILAFVAGKYELTFAGTLTIALTHDLQTQRPDAICELPPGSVSTNLIINRTRPPFDNPALRRAMALAIDRQAFIDILTEGNGLRAAAMQPSPGGQWGMPPAMLATLPGYGSDVAANRTAARAIMQTLGYGPDKRLAIKVSTRDIPPYRDPAVILIDQLKEIYIDADLELLDTTQWYPKVMRKDYTVALNLTGTMVDDPDALLYENYACGGIGNYNGYCNPAVDRLIDQQSMEPDQDKRRHMVWEIERRLTEDDAKPLVYFNRGGICWDPKVKGLTVMVNSIYNGWRMEDIWLDR